MRSRLDKISYIAPNSKYVDEVLNDDGVAAMLKEDGFSRVPISQTDIISLIGAALEHRKLEYSEALLFDAIILGTESYDETFVSERGYRSFRRRFKNMLDQDFELGGSPIYAVSMAGCANFTSCLTAASAFVESGFYDNVLVILADRVLPGRSRLLKNKAAVLGDAVASFVISRSGRFTVQFIKSVAIEERAELRSLSLLKAVREIKVAGETKLAFPLTEVKYFYGDNLFSTLHNIVAEGLEISSGRIFLPHKSSTGHAFAADCPIILHDALKQHRFSHGDTIGLINIGAARVGLVVLSFEP